MRIVIQDEAATGSFSAVAELAAGAWTVKVFRNGFAERVHHGVLAPAADVAAIAIGLLQQAALTPPDRCASLGCPVPATHERLAGLVHGLPVYEAACARHGDRVRT